MPPDTLQDLLSTNRRQPAMKEDRHMPRTTITLSIVLSLALVSACTNQPGEAATTPSAVAGTKTPASSSSTPAATPSTPASPESVDSAGNLATCELVDTAASSQLEGLALATARNKPGTALRVAVATAYADLAEQLVQLSAGSSGNLTDALTTWATASTRVAQYLVSDRPRAGLAIDYGPTAKPWASARKSTEAICGHRLPSTR